MAVTKKWSKGWIFEGIISVSFFELPSKKHMLPFTIGKELITLSFDSLTSIYDLWNCAWVVVLFLKVVKSIGFIGYKLKSSNYSRNELISPPNIIWYSVICLFKCDRSVFKFSICCLFLA